MYTLLTDEIEKKELKDGYICWHNFIESLLKIFEIVLIGE